MTLSQASCAVFSILLFFSCSEPAVEPTDAEARDSAVAADAAVIADADAAPDAEVPEDASVDAGAADGGELPIAPPWGRRLGGGPGFDNGNSLALGTDGVFFTSGNHGGQITFEPSFGP